MIGIYNYTVILTYLSLISAGTGIIVTLSDNGHPYWGVLFLLLCGLCDAFDGQVARTKKDRTKSEINYGIQIDSLSDVVAFGVLPACIGIAIFRTSAFIDSLSSYAFFPVLKYSFFAILVLYILAALIRLAHFNVTEEERQSEEGGVRKYYTGLPVTSAALIFPSFMILRYITPVDISIAYLPLILFTAFAFLGKFTLRKPKLCGILIMVGIGFVEAVILVLRLFLK
ncbi:MAG: phosphatidylserine synthase [Ruminococcaceae bacterium]|nr:phosphatidylserine synthase [Oscillospiraceae bacterium]MBQ7120081.1 CDP-alcohol phosphatidyltransferase family protein [Oscillospiraceae bacterium]